MYEISEEKAKDINKFYETKLAGKKHFDSTKYYKAYLIDDYYALGPNCTTLSVVAAKVALPDIDREWSAYQQGRGLTFMEKSIVSAHGWPKGVFMPADLQVMLESPSGRKPKTTKSYGGKK